MTKALDAAIRAETDILMKDLHLRNGEDWVVATRREVLERSMHRLVRAALPDEPTTEMIEAIPLHAVEARAAYRALRAYLLGEDDGLIDDVEGLHFWKERTHD